MAVLLVGLVQAVDPPVAPHVHAQAEGGGAVELGLVARGQAQSEIEIETK